MRAYIKNIAYSLPAAVRENPPGRLTKKTGIARVHIAAEGERASDLAVRAAEQLFAMGAPRAVDMLLYCTQSPDYILPTTACIVQDRLGLPRTCGALDINLGCSGYIYALSLAKGLIESGQARRVLLITAETYSRHINPADHSTMPLFGDGATATLIEGVATDAPGLDGFAFGTDGSGYASLIIPAGGQVQPLATGAAEVDDYGNVRTDRDIHMSGSAISEFALDVVPETLERVLAQTHLTRADIGYFVFHQANKFMLSYLQQKCKLMDYPYWNDVTDYGNTVSSSVPIALTDMLARDRQENPRVLSIGFGVGLSWAGCIIDTRYVNI